MNSLEQYLKEQRPRLDQIEEPRREIIWAGIQSGLKEQKNANAWAIHIGANWRWSIAASIAILLIAGIWRFSVSEKSTTPRLTQFYPALAEQEAQFQRLIALKETELKVDQLDQDAYHDIFQELRTLDAVYEELKLDMPVSIAEDRLLNTLIKYYERKIRILERLSREIQKRNHDEKKQYESLI